MEPDGLFANFDNEDVYKESLRRALNDNTLNFVVEFGKDEAKIAFDLDEQHVKSLLAEGSKPAKRPVRWM